MSSMMIRSSILNKQDNQTIAKQGIKIYTIIKSHQKKWGKEFFISLILKISSHNEEFKTNLFRLIDVLPSLRNSTAVAQHMDEYLSAPAKKINFFLGWFFKIPLAAPLLAKLSDLILKFSIKQISSFYIAGDSAERISSLIKKIHQKKMTYTIDLLGEYTLSKKEALAYQQRYLDILNNLKVSTTSKYTNKHLGLRQDTNISIKLTALYSQCSILNLEASVLILIERLTPILRKAKAQNCGIYFDAEDQKYNQIIYKVFEEIYSLPEFSNFPLPGIVIQAYDTKAIKVIQRFINFAKSHQKKITIRLVKGAYWNHEHAASAQNNRKCSLFPTKAQTDLNYERLSGILLENSEYIYPAFASHNIRSLLSAIQQAKNLNISSLNFEIQMLYGMAERIALAFRDEGYLVRLYLPVGELIPGMGYLVRRLLENTANDSFLRQTFHDEKDIAKLLQDPKIFVNKSI